MIIKSWPKLIISILLSQSAGLIGTFFTVDAIPTWYLYLNKPFFSPPNWLFAPVWTILYTMIGVSFYLIWIKSNKKDLWPIKFFLFHLFLNSIWSIIFFGVKNLGLAFFEIVLMWLTIVYMIKIYFKINKWASYLLIPYLLWVSFATILNLSVWVLNPSNQTINVFAQEFNLNKAREDYVFSEDNYKKDLEDFRLKKASYKKNPTLSLKEELRLSVYKFIGSRNSLIKSYLTMVRMKAFESKGLSQSEKEQVYTLIDTEVKWYENRKENYTLDNTLEEIINKSKEEDVRYRDTTLQTIYFSLIMTGLGDTIDLKSRHVLLFTKLKNEALSLVELGRADSSLFERWYLDIDREIVTINNTEKSVKLDAEAILTKKLRERIEYYNAADKKLELRKANLIKINKYLMELENVIINKR